VEVIIALVLAITLAGLALPATASALDDGRARQAAGFAAGELRDAKQQAVMRGASVGLAFDLAGTRWTYRRCVDGNANGVRRADMKIGKDRCADPIDVSALFPGVSVAIDPTIRGPDDDPPSADPVRFGASNLASFSPAGSCSAGTLFLRSARGVQFAVRVAGVTGRMRVLRYNPGTRKWSEL
jgi:hypothetical protein